MITGLYLAILAVAQVFMVPWIAKTRMREGVSLGEGSDALNRKMRVYGNFTEIVPIALMLMVVAELGGAPIWSIHVLGAMIVASRISHACGLMTGKGYGLYRAGGMLLAMAAILAGAVLCATLALPNVL